MTAAMRASASVKAGTSHRVYRDDNGTDTAFCRLVASEDELFRLAAGIDRIELRQAPGTGWIPSMMTNPIIAALRSVDLCADSADPRAERIARDMRRRLTDALARIRVRCNRYVLAGTTRIFDEDEDKLVLVLVLARKGIHSCEWKLAA
jgi:hypothetical protein